MRWIPMSAIAAAVLVLAASSWPAEAQNRSRAGVRAGQDASQGTGYRRAGPRARTATRSGARTRITVRKGRSFLDPGTEVLPGTAYFTDYAFPPLWHPQRIWDPTGSTRSPLPDTWEFPGYFQ